MNTIEFRAEKFRVVAPGEAGVLADFAGQSRKSLRRDTPAT